MIGRRLPDGYHTFDSVAGDYWKTPEGDWEIRDPLGVIGGIGDHKVEEHEDGTITVSPSIQDPNPGGWHGYLERGIWSS
jgi:hypothetical protein